jgi:4-amino-4-deoxychorismate lyase
MWAMMSSTSYLVNGQFNQSISPFDRGFAYGDGVFRTLKISKGLPENWPQHYQKLVADCAAIRIVCPNADLLIDDLSKLFSPTDYGVAKVIITRGEGARGYSLPPITAPLRVVTKSAMPTYPESRFLDGVDLHVCETRLAPQPTLAGIKHLNRLENIMARMEWSDPALVDGILCDAHGNVIECTSANIFARYGQILKTPSLHDCGVAGVTRQRIMALAYTLSLQVVVESISLNQLLLADEIVICNSLYGAWQVRRIQDKSIPMAGLGANIRAALEAHQVT